MTGNQLPDGSHAGRFLTLVMTGRKLRTFMSYAQEVGKLRLIPLGKGQR